MDINQFHAFYLQMSPIMYIVCEKWAMFIYMYLQMPYVYTNTYKRIQVYVAHMDLTI